MNANLINVAADVTVSLSQFVPQEPTNDPCLRSPAGGDTPLGATTDGRFSFLDAQDSRLLSRIRIVRELERQISNCGSKRAGGRDSNRPRLIEERLRSAPGESSEAWRLARDLTARERFPEVRALEHTYRKLPTNCILRVPRVTVFSSREDSPSQGIFSAPTRKPESWGSRNPESKANVNSVNNR